MIELLGGKNHYLLQAAVKTRRAKYDSDTIEVIDATQSDWNDVNQAVTGISLFAAEDRLVIINDIEQNKQLADQLASNLEHIPSSTYVLLVSPGVDKRSVLYKKVKKEGLVEDFKELEAHDLVRWVRENVASQGGEISSGDARFLVERVGEKQQLLSMEIAKLLTYDEKITKASIELLVAPALQDTIFELLDATTAGNHEKARMVYRRLSQAQVQPVYIVVMLSWQLHSLLAVTLAGSRSDREIASEVKLSPFVVGKARTLFRRLDRSKVAQMIDLVAETDIKLKTRSIDADASLEVLLTKLALLCKH